MYFDLLAYLLYKLLKNWKNGNVGGKMLMEARNEGEDKSPE